ncbi:MAG TPA: site-2 protease family protein [Elusimicrobiales bacterium]|nr:site-2 protease family protein [Elusimicrobiales bacterium]
MEWLIQFPVLLFSIIFHEFSHGAAAYRRGDDTAYLSNRLTLNPLPHIDPVGSILVPAVCVLSHLPVIGWARPVPINPLRMPRPRRDMAMVALGGPLSNVALAVAALLAYKIFALGFLGGDLTLTLLKTCVWGIVINMMLALFNLLPVYPLDGSHVALEFLPDRLLAIYERHIPYGMYIILGLMFTGAIKAVMTPFLALLSLVMYLAGVDVRILEL